jgi:hypothetical protein
LQYFFRLPVWSFILWQIGGKCGHNFCRYAVAEISKPFTLRPQFALWLHTKILKHAWGFSWIRV